MLDDTLDDEVILLEQPILDADELIEAEYTEPGVDQNEIETEQVVLLDQIRLDDGDVEFA